ncbi:hypothetical protein LCGC14_0565530 [marine sediment metagenome]|uniref:Helix-turn-helix domain-containing protein n=1 Tax=marine sediment metagenome TaxID=412755 RepID=A0A0F9U716_9ZZZZ
MEQVVTDNKPLLHSTDIASRLAMSDRTVRKWITVGLNGKKLKATRANNTGMWLVSEEDLADFLTDNADGEAE